MGDEIELGDGHGMPRRDELLLCGTNVHSVVGVKMGCKIGAGVASHKHQIFMKPATRVISFGYYIG